MSINRLFSSSAGIALAAAAFSVGAQVPRSTASSAGNAVTELTEVIVTAQKRSEDLQTTPISITALTADKLEQMSANNLADLGPSLPNVVISGDVAVGNAAANFYIRGVGLDRNTTSQEQGVGLYIDDIYYGRSPGAFLSLLDVKSVEVLRGPQGTLFGKNTIGGAIRYITEGPSFDNTGYIDVKVGERRHLDVRGSVNLAVSSALAFKVTAGSFNSGGYVRGLTNNVMLGDDHTNAARVGMLWQPTDRLTVLASADATSSSNNGPPLTTRLINPQSGLAATWTLLNPSRPLDNRYAGPLYQNNNNSRPFDLTGLGLNLNVAYQVGDHLTLKSISGYRRNKAAYFYDFDGSPLPVWQTQVHDDLPMFSQEFQAVGDLWNSRVQYIAGLYYFRETPDQLQEGTVFFQVPGDNRLLKLKSQSYAAFGQAIIEIADNLKLTAGARYTQDRKTSSTIATLTGLAGVASDSWSNLAPKIALQYQWTPSAMTYVSASRGYRAGGFNTDLNNTLINNGIVPYGPEDAWSYELGAKTQVLDNRVRLNIALFQLDYTDLQLTVPFGPTATLITGNAGKARIRGMEFDGAFIPLPGLTLEASVGTIDAKYVSAPPTSGVALDDKFAGAPKTSYSLGATYERGLAGRGKLGFHADYGYKSEVKTFRSNLVASYVPPVGLVNAEIRYMTQDERNSFALQGRNVTNERYITTGFQTTAPLPFLLGVDSASVGRPSEFYLTFKRKF
jgi:iron complex outermembrane receptor protein